MNANFRVYPKLQKVKALYKKGDKNNPDYYRPISLLYVIDKVQKKFLYRRKYKCLDENNLYVAGLKVFRSKYSCIHTICKVTDITRQEIYKKISAQACFIDLRKAFDLLDRGILLKNALPCPYRTHSSTNQCLFERQMAVY